VNLFLTPAVRHGWTVEGATPHFDIAIEYGRKTATEVSPTRVAAQVVSGIGFLGAGLIFKEGLSVRGLNTAATLWCSAAIGVLSGAGFLAHALLATVLVIGINLLLRPAMTWINQRLPAAVAEVDQAYGVSVVRRGADEAHVRALLLQGLATGDMHLVELESTNIEGSDRSRWRPRYAPTSAMT
jgi:putative Mg2+ transporter-C (MgtC) family protein